VVIIAPFFRLQGLKRIYLLAAFLVKILAGFGLTWIYTHFYDDRNLSDIFKFYDDSRFMIEALQEKPKDYFMMLLGLDGNKPYYDQYYYQMNNWFKAYDQGWFNDTRTMIRLNAFLGLFSFGVYHVHTIFFSFIAFCGLVLIYRSVQHWFMESKWLLFAVIFFMPSVLCWTSGILKETFLLLGMGLFLFGLFSNLKARSRISPFIYSGFGIFIMLFVKPYILIAFIPGVMALALSKFLPKIKVAWHFLASYAICILMLFVAAQLGPQYNLLEQLSERQQSVWRLAFYVDSGSLIEAEPLNPNLPSLLRNLPEAIINTAFRPSIMDAKNALQWMAAFENLMIIICMIFSIGLFKYDPSKLKIALFISSFVIIVYALSGLTTPVLGTLVRYRVPALPFFMMLCFLMFDHQRFNRIINETFSRIE
jgi:hypothetical protein